MMRRMLCLAALGLFLQWTEDAKADNFVVNGGFESGDFDGWTLGGDTRYDRVITYNVQSGDYAARFAGFGSDTVLSQYISTPVEANYLVSYWLAGDGQFPNDIAVSFGEQMLFSQVDVSPFSYTQYSFNVWATAPISTLEFDARDDPAYFYLDDVFVTPALPGDANADGKVDVNDLTIVLTGYGTSGTIWNQGDFNNDTMVDVNDLTIVLTNYGTTSSASIKTVPEPSCVVLLGIALFGQLAIALRRAK
jgi:hypothetical protein